MTLRFAPPVPDEFDDGTIDREDHLAEGALVILYDNDDIQSFALSAEYRHPELVAVRPGGRGAADEAAEKAENAEAAEKDATMLTSIDLGEAHVRGWGSDPTLASRRFTLVNASAADARWRCEVAGRNPGVFSVTPSSGVARGRGRHGVPGRVEVEVRFAPRAEMRYEAALRFEVDEARIPNLSSLAPRLNPSASRGTTKAEMPLCLRALSALWSRRISTVAALPSLAATMRGVFRVSLWRASTAAPCRKSMRIIFWFPTDVACRRAFSRDHGSAYPSQPFANNAVRMGV